MPQVTCTARKTLVNPSVNKRVKQAILRSMAFRQPATDVCAPVTNFKRCSYDAVPLTGCCICCSRPFCGRMHCNGLSVLAVTSVHVDASMHILLSSIATISVPKCQSE